MSTSKIIERIKKILTLANCPGATEGEIQAATAKAQLLLEQHQLSMMDVLSADDASEETVKELEIHTDMKRLSINTRLIVSGVAKSFQCHMVFKRMRSGRLIFSFIGLPEDTQVAAQMYDMLSGRLPKMGRDRAYTHGCDTTGATRAFVTAYILGAMQAIKARLERERAAREAANCQVTALVVRKDELIQGYMDKNYKDLKGVPKSRCKIDIAGQHAGYEDGSTMGLNRPIAQGKE